MGKVRLGPVALTLIIVVLPFAGMWPDRSDAAGAKVLASASNAPQIVGASAKASGLIAVKQRSNRLNSKQAPPAQTNTDTSFTGRVIAGHVAVFNHREEIGRQYSI